jgi:hypothetical protein
MNSSTQLAQKSRARSDSTMPMGSSWALIFRNDGKRPDPKPVGFSFDGLGLSLDFCLESQAEHGPMFST